jgi:hypothetical protein
MSEKLPGRNALLRSALFYTPLFIITLAGVIGIVTGLFQGGWLLLIISAIAALLFGYQSIQALRDLHANRIITTQGPVSRIWSKMDLFISRSYYINVNRNIFRIPIQAYWDLREEAKRMRADGTDQDYRIEVKVEHYPHTGNVVSVDRVGVIPIEQAAASQERAG